VETFNVIAHRSGNLVIHVLEYRSVQGDTVSFINGLKTHIDLRTAIVCDQGQLGIYLVLIQVFGEVAHYTIDDALFDLKPLFFKSNRVTATLLKEVDYVHNGHFARWYPAMDDNGIFV